MDQPQSDQALATRVRAAQISQTYTQTTVALLTNPIVAAGVVAVLWPVVSHLLLMAWMGAHLLVQCGRLLVLFGYRTRKPEGTDVAYWGKLQTIGSALSGAVWGSTFFLLWPAGQPLYQMVLPVVIVGLGAGAAAGYSPIRASYISFILLSHVPLVYRFLSEGTVVHMALGLLALLYIWTLYQVGKNVHDSGAHALSLNEQLHQKNAQLQVALDNIKTLKGLLPICAQCKKIRDDEGFWEQVEVYITEHSDAEFTHSFCPECARDFFPGYAE